MLLPKLELFTQPLDAFQTIPDPRDDTNSSTFDQYRQGEDVNSFWGEYQREYGRYSMLVPIIDWYNVFYGREDVNDLDILATTFDLSGSIFSAAGYNPWFTDGNSSPQTYQSNAPKALAIQYQTTRSNSAQPAYGVPSEGNSDIVVYGSVKPIGFSSNELVFISLDLTQSNVRTGLSGVYADAAASILSKAVAAFNKIVADLAAKFPLFADSTALTFTRSGVSVTVKLGDINHIFKRIDISVKEGLNLPKGWGGATDKKADGSGRWYSNVETKQFSNYYSTLGGDKGILWYLIHEVIHNTPTVKAYEKTQTDSYLINHPGSFANYGSSPQFKNVEKMTNEIYRLFVNKVGLPLVQNPPQGYF